MGKVKDIINSLVSNISKVFTLIGDIFKLTLKVVSEVVFKVHNNFVVKLHNALEKINENINKRLDGKFSVVVCLLKGLKWIVSLLYKFLDKLNIIFEEIVIEVDKATNNSYSKPERDLDVNNYIVEWEGIINDDVNFGLSGGIYHQINKDTFEFNMYFDEDNQPFLINEKLKDIDIKQLRKLGKMHFCKHIVDHIYNNKYTNKLIDTVGNSLDDHEDVKHKVYEKYRVTFYEDNDNTACLIEEYKRKEWKFIALFELDDIKNESDVNEFIVNYDNNFNINVNEDNYIDIIDDILKSNIKDNKVNILDILTDIFNNGVTLITTIVILYTSIKSIKLGLTGFISNIVSENLQNVI